MQYTTYIEITGADQGLLSRNRSGNDTHKDKIQVNYLELSKGIDELSYTRHLSSCFFVGCTHSPRSHSYLCSRGFAPLPPRCILKSIGYI